MDTIHSTIHPSVYLFDKSVWAIQLSRVETARKIMAKSKNLCEMFGPKIRDMSCRDDVSQQATDPQLAMECVCCTE